MAKQQDMFTDITLAPAPTEPSATVHDILRATGGRSGATAFYEELVAVLEA